MAIATKAPRPAPTAKPARSDSPAILARPEPNAREARTLTEESTANPKTNGTARTVFAKAQAASGTTPTRPTMIVSAQPMSI